MSRMLILLCFMLLITDLPGVNPPGGNLPGKEDPPLLVNQGFMPQLPVLSNDPEPLGDFAALTLPLKQVGRLFLIDAVIDGVTGNLVFDTGATGLVLNRTYFRNYAVVEGGQSNGITGPAGKIGYTTADKVQIGDLYYENIKADLADLGHIENRRGAKIIGLLGFNMIRSFEIVIDARQGELQLYRIDKKGERLQRQDSICVFDCSQKIDAWHPVVIIRANIAGKNLSFCFDTGAETNAISSQLPKSVMNTISITRRSDLRGAGQASTEVLYGIMNDFTLNNKPMNSMETVIVNLDGLSEAYGVHIDGMLGFGFLEQGIVTINLAKKLFGIRYHKPAGS